MEIVGSKDLEHYLVKLLEVVSELFFVLDLTYWLNEASQEVIALLWVVMANWFIEFQEAEHVFPQREVSGFA